MDLLLWILNCLLKKQQKSKESAKSRLQLVLIHDRESREGPDFLPQLKLDIIAAIKKYIPISDEQVMVNVSQKDDTSMMEVSVSLDPKFDDSVPKVHGRYETEEDINDIKSINQ